MSNTIALHVHTLQFTVHQLIDINLIIGTHFRILRSGMPNNFHQGGHLNNSLIYYPWLKYQGSSTGGRSECIREASAVTEQL